MMHKIERLRKQEGFQEPADIYDMTTFQDIYKELERLDLNINEKLDEDTLDNEQKQNLKRIRDFCVETSNEFKVRFTQLLEQYGKEGKKISQKIIDYILEKKFNLPEFTIAQGPEAQKQIEEYGFKDTVMTEQSFLLAFQLPKPLAHFWWKGGTDSWGEMGKKVDDVVIEWGHFYRQMMGVIWGCKVIMRMKRALISFVSTPAESMIQINIITFGMYVDDNQNTKNKHQR